MITHETIVTGRVYEILREYLGSDVTLSPDSDLLNDLGMDSLEQVELGLKLEKDFRVKIPVADLRGCITVGEVIELVCRLAIRRPLTLRDTESVKALRKGDIKCELTY